MYRHLRSSRYLRLRPSSFRTSLTTLPCFSLALGALAYLLNTIAFFRHPPARKESLPLSPPVPRISCGVCWSRWFSAQPSSLVISRGHSSNIPPLLNTVIAFGVLIAPLILLANALALRRKSPIPRRHQRAHRTRRPGGALVARHHLTNPKRPQPFRLAPTDKPKQSIDKTQLSASATPAVLLHETQTIVAQTKGLRILSRQ